jgi:uridine phosphorylase
MIGASTRSFMLVFPSPAQHASIGYRDAMRRRFVEVVGCRAIPSLLPVRRRVWDALPRPEAEPIRMVRGGSAARASAAYRIDGPLPYCKNPGMTRGRDPPRLPPILAGKDYRAVSVFEPANLLREARRQKRLTQADVPEICLLDPDGDIVRALRRAGRASPSPGWACYHTELFEFEHEAMRFGIIGCAVGASFAVLLAEELFVSGCRLLLSVTSAGQIAARGNPPYFVVIDRALRDEGTSYHYLPPENFAAANPALVAQAMAALRHAGSRVYRGASWTTDAPFRETAEAIEQAQARGILAVEMEAAALYAFARARGKPVLCLAHVTNQMAVNAGDFDKGEADGAEASLAIVAAIARAWLTAEGDGQ